MSLAICHGVRRWRVRATFVVALAFVIASFVLAHSALSAGHMPLAAHEGMSGAAMVCPFIAQASSAVRDGPPLLQVFRL